MLPSPDALKKQPPVRFGAVLLYLFIQFFFIIHANGQYCDWLEVGGSSGTETAVWIATDNNKDAIIIGSYRDSFSVGNDTFPEVTATNATGGFVIKYDTGGRVLWGLPYQLVGTAHCVPSAVATDNQDNIYVTGYFKGTVDFGSNDTLTAVTTSVFLVKHSASGSVIWARLLGITVAGIQHLRVVVDNDSNVYMGCSYSGTATFPGTSVTLTNPSGRTNIQVCKFNSDGVFLNAVRAGGNTTYEYFRDMDIDAAANIYILGYFQGDFTFGSQTLTDTGEMILKFDSSFTPIKGHGNNLNMGAQHGGGTASFGIGVLPSGKFAVANNFVDSVNFGNNVWLRSHKNMGNPATGGGIVFYDEQLIPQWAVKGDSVSGPLIFTARAGVEASNGNLYVGGGYKGKVRLGNSVIGSGVYLEQFFVAKLDTLGNVLWAFGNDDTTNFGVMHCSTADKSGDVHITGIFHPRVSVFDKSSYGYGASDFFTAKIIDYEIWRGYVKSGPYCAGDSIIIPYTKTGNYTIGNDFIAQLSDSAGNFNGNELELGRVTDTAGGIIKGTIPAFNVATSQKYRIRIMSTRPVVQSYYKIDTLRLLIYSKDTANAGPDTTICKGQSVRLGTTGGSKWKWSPDTYMPVTADTSNRQPLVNPTVTTEYRIIISDSSGCGVTDTDFVKIIVRPYIETELHGDTNICRGFEQTLRVKVTGGNEKQYWYQWKVVGLNIVLSRTDSLYIRPFNTTKYLVAVGDSCSDKIDTAYITIYVTTKLNALTSPDTTICYGGSATLSVTGDACNPDYYKYQWFEIGKAGSVGSGATLPVSPLVTTFYRVILSDTSTLLVDTKVVTVTVLQPLNISINQDTTICYGNPVDLKALTTGGNSVNNGVVWSEVGGQWSVNGQQATVNPTKTTTYRAVLTDNCSSEPDSADITITVRPPLKVAINADTTICIGESAELRAGITGGYAPNHKIVWSEVGGPWSVGNAVTTVNPTVTTTYRAVLTDNCTTPGDSADITVTVRPPLKVTVNPDTTICVGESAELRAVTTGGYSPNYKITWIDINGPWTVDGGLLTINPTTTTTYRAILTDNCTTPGDSAEVTVTVRPPLQLTTTSSSDSICGNQTVVLSANLSGGLSSSLSLLWTADSGPWTSTQNPASDQPKLTTTYIARLSDNCSPDVFDTLIVFVLPVPKADFSINPKQGCPPLKVTLTDLSADHDTTLNTWKVQATEAQGITQYTHEFTQTGTYNVGLTVSNALGCMDNKWVTSAVTVFEKPTAQFIAKPDIKEIESPIYLYHQSSRAIKYTWDFGDGNYLYQNNNNDTFYSYNDTGYMSIRLIAENSRGCADTQTQILQIFDKINCVIPNAFTPNNRDDLNPTFAPVCVGAASYEMTIFNRWGQVIQSCENCAWDGTFADKPVPAGVYLYKLIITAESKKEATSFGTVNVVR